jgi:hypothetical protein
MSDAPRFPFAFAAAYRAPAGVFGTVPHNCWVELREHEMVARFGLWGLRTTYANIVAVEITGPYAFWKTAGPARLGVTDRGLTFATNRERGVLITFVRPVRSSGPTFLLRHPELTVTVADVEGLARELRARIPADEQAPRKRRR